MVDDNVLNFSIFTYTPQEREKCAKDAPRSPFAISFFWHQLQYELAAKRVGGYSTFFLMRRMEN